MGQAGLQDGVQDGPQLGAILRQLGGVPVPVFFTGRHSTSSWDFVMAALFGRGGSSLVRCSELGMFAALLRIADRRADMRPGAASGP